MAYVVRSNTVINTDVTTGGTAGAFRAAYYKNDRVSTAQGKNFAYLSGGYTSLVPYVASNVIQRFPFASSTPSVSSVGSMTVSRYRNTGQSSSTHGYSSGGLIPAVPASTNVIDRFPFAVSTTNATDVGDLTVGREYLIGHSSSTHGYAAGGTISPPAALQNIIDRFPFAVATVNATDVGDLTVNRSRTSAQNSFDYGYASGTFPLNISIDRFPFAATTTNATNIGNLSVGSRAYTAGQSSFDNGYTSGGFSPGTYYNVIDRFPFASGAVTAADVGDLTITASDATGHSSLDFGYHSGGQRGPLGSSTVIQRFTFSSEKANATDVGNIPASPSAFQTVSGQQY